MRKLLIFIFIATVAFIAVNSCKKGDTAGDFHSLGIGSYVTLVAAGNSIIDYSNLNNSKVDITVKEYGSPIDKVKIYVSEGTPNLDKAVWKFVKEIPYSGETKLEVKATEIAAGLGIPPASLKTGSTYTLYNQLLTKDGRVFDPSNTNAGFQGNSNYKMAMTWSAVVVCPFVGPIAGNYKVVQDDWVDWSPGDIVPVTDGPGANQVNISRVWPNPAYGSVVNPLVVSVNPATGAITIPSGVVWGNYGSYNTSTGTGSSGFIFSCTGQVILTVHVIATGFGDQGFLKLILQKQ